MKKLAKAGLAVLPAAVFAAVFILCSRPEQRPDIPAKTEDERLAYLASCGIEGELLSEHLVTVPGEDAVFADYLALQELQKLPLAAHTGEAATVYTYRIAGSSLRAELLCAGDVLIGAQLYLPEEAQGMPLSGALAP
ncbi:MAG: DUF4830 domain-containing protein [Oscillospiraceae bacterium]|nr:DUF4830 domain-containing protein [Oscillospiraceae bacterium]